MATQTIQLRAVTNWPKLDHEFSYIRARVRRMRKRDRGAFIEREVQRAAAACVRIVTA